MTTYVGLLRAVNVGGRNTLPMARLRELCGELGFEDARTYVQSGNVVFRSALRPGDVRAQLEQRVGRELGAPAVVVLRTAQQLRKAVEANPFARDGVPESQLHAAFLTEKPRAALVAQLDPDRGAPDAFRVVGDTIYLHLPNGIGRSKLTNPWFERTLGVGATARNWRTVEALVEMATT